MRLFRRRLSSARPPHGRSERSSALRGLRLAGKVLAGVVVVVVLAAVLVPKTGFVQERLIRLATDAIRKELHADVEIGSVSVSLLGQQASVYDVRLKDQSQRDMVRVGQIWGNLRLLPLLQGRVVLKEFKVSDINLLVVKPDSGPANYQFLLDANKKDPAAPKQQKKKKKTGGTFQLDLRHAMIQRLHLKYNDLDYAIDKVVYSDWRDNRHIDLKGLKFMTDNHKPRKNVGKPHRGAFDAGHMDVTADLGIDLLRADKDSVCVRLTDCCLRDTTAGFDIHDLQADVRYSHGRIRLSDATFTQLSTRFDIPTGDILLPDKAKGTPLHYHADSVYVRTLLKDISKPFAPVLRRFSVPLNVRTGIDGNALGMTFHGISVETDDRKLVIHSTGVMRNIKKARDLTLHFEVLDMVAKPGIKDLIINQFTVKKYMMYQIYALGVVKYHGSFDILWRKQQFRGLLDTEKGCLDFEFQVDGQTKYLTGRVSTDSLKLGELFKLKRLKDIDCSAAFKIDISKPRTAEVRRERGGKLPIGEVSADIRKVGYRSTFLHNIAARICSDGAEAVGDVTLMGHMTDLMLEFTFTNTEEMHKMKVKPRLKYRSLVASDD